MSHQVGKDLVSLLATDASELADIVFFFFHREPSTRVCIPKSSYSKASAGKRMFFCYYLVNSPKPQASQLQAVRIPSYHLENKILVQFIQYIFDILGSHTISRDTKDNRHCSHVGVPNKRNDQNSFVKSTPTWPLCRQVKTGYMKIT